MRRDVIRALDDKIDLRERELIRLSVESNVAKTDKVNGEKEQEDKGAEEHIRSS